MLKAAAMVTVTTTAFGGRMAQETIDRLTGQAVAPASLALGVIIPTFNEADNIEPMLDRLAVALDGIAWEVIFVDDNSPDGTAALVRRIGITHRHVRVVQRIGRRGLSSAVVEGMLASCAPVLAVIDGDQQHDESILPQLFGIVARGEADLAVGTRYADGGSTGDWAASRVRLSRLATLMGQQAIATGLSDPMSGYFVIHRDAMMAAVPRLSSIGFKVLLDIVASSPRPLKIAEVAYRFRARTAGESKADARVFAEFALLLVDKKLGHLVPIRLISFLGVGALGVGVHLAVLGSAIGLGAHFLTAQSLAVLVAMTFNFLLNNVLTYRDRRLTGIRLLTGLLSFYAVCLIGAAANVGIGNWVNDTDGRWWLAGIAGAAVGAIWNFAVTSVVTWRKR